MVVFATPDRLATSSTLNPPIPLSLSSSKAVVSTRSRERWTRLSISVSPGSAVGAPERRVGRALPEVVFDMV
jgi:hypothetical protein